MFVARLLLIFLVLPVMLVAVSYALSIRGRLLLLFVIWPLGLMLFAWMQFLRDRRRSLPEDELEQPDQPALAERGGRLS